MSVMANFRQSACPPLPSLEKNITTGTWNRFILFLNERLFSPMAGITLGDWLELLRENRFAVDPPFWPRAALLTMCSLVNSGSRWTEDLLHGRDIGRVKVKPPLFILGHWRSGTSHLHNLLSLDRQFAFPNLYQVVQPHSFLCTEDACSSIINFFLPKKRLMDNLPLGTKVPKEDEFALCAASIRSQQLSLVFGRREAYYERYLTFRGVPQKDITRWKKAFVYFVKKLTWKYGRPILLKSPHHTCRIKLLLEMFPDARFLHIVRNPFAVFNSVKICHEKSVLPFALQDSDGLDVDAGIIRRYRIMYDAYFEERGLIPAGRLHELSLEQLEEDPVGQVRRCYEKLDLPDFAAVQPALRDYAESLANYQKNPLAELAAPLRQRIVQAWRRCFEEWGYPL